MELAIKCAISLIFVLAVVGKLTGKTKSTFHRAGYSNGVMYTTAIVEILLTIGLFTYLDKYAAWGLVMVMVAAMITLLRQKARAAEYTGTIIATALLIVLLIQIS